MEMGKMKANPRYNVISMRICADEHKLLERICRKKKTNITGIMREAMEHVISQAGDQSGSLLWLQHKDS
jgi:hypothetical protein